jgi:putative RNA 2'-phosphotransferase
LALDNERLKVSRFMSFVLRHKPEAIGLVLDRDDWIDLSEFVSQFSSTFPDIEREVA